MTDDTSLPFVTEGILAGTLMATPSGWRDVADLAAGDEVMTLEFGALPICAVQMAFCTLSEWPEPLWPLNVPQGALGNPSALRLLPEQPVLLEQNPLEDGELLAVVPAAAFDGWRNIARVRPEAVEQAFTLLMPQDCLVLGAGRVLFCCPADGLGLPLGEGEAEWWDLLPLAEARNLIAQLEPWDEPVRLSRE